MKLIPRTIIRISHAETIDTPFVGTLDPLGLWLCVCGVLGLNRHIPAGYEEALKAMASRSQERR